MDGIATARFVGNADVEVGVFVMSSHFWKWDESWVCGGFCIYVLGFGVELSDALR